MDKCKRIKIVIGSSLVIILLSYLVKYLCKTFSIAVPCIFHYITGLYCPGCGMTRAIYNLMEFNLKDALRNNFLLIFIIPFFVYYIAKFIYCFINDIFLKDRTFFNQKVAMALLVITILFGILRNFDYFYFLKPI